MLTAPATLMPTPRGTVLEDGPAKLYHFEPKAGVRPSRAPPVLLVPSMINRWYVLDLRRGSSVAEAFTDAGLDTWCLDWGAPQPCDRYFTWADAVARLERMVRRVKRETGQPKLSVLGYCMGATLASVHAALYPQHYAGFVNLLGPIDFSEAGHLGRMTDPRWFDAAAVAEAGNVAPQQMQAGFVMLRPTQNVSKPVTVLDRAFDPAFRESFEVLEWWANDNVAFPAAAYETYITELYQQNRLVQGTHRVAGKAAKLSAINCPVLTIAAEKDTICPPKAATALNSAVGAGNTAVVSVPGGHVGAVVGSKAAQKLYPTLVNWMKERTCN